MQRQQVALMPQHRLDRAGEQGAGLGRIGGGLGVDRHFAPVLHQDTAGAGQGQQILGAASGLKNGRDMIGGFEPRRHLAEPEHEIGGSIVGAVPRHQLGQVKIGFELERGQAIGVAHAAKAATWTKPRA